MIIEVYNESNENIFDFIVKGVRNFNFQTIGEERSQPLMVVIRNDSGEIVGGIAGRTICTDLVIT